jgi:hypothetical protein
MRPISHGVYGITRERVIGSATPLEYVTDEYGGANIRRPEADYLDDGPQKPIRIWTRVGRPCVATLMRRGRCSGRGPGWARRSRWTTSERTMPLGRSEVFAEAAEWG